MRTAGWDGDHDRSAYAVLDDAAREELALVIRAARLRLECHTAGDRMMLALRALERKYRPDQPRVPKGNSDGGQWTDDLGSGGGRTDSANERYDLTDPGPLASAYGDALLLLVNRGGGRRRLAPTVVINGRRVQATPAQALQLDLLSAEAARVVRDARTIQPGWRPRPGAYGDVQGLIAQRRAEIAEARAFVAMRGGGRPVPNSLADVLAPSGTVLGKPGPSDSIQVVPRFEMLPALGRLTAEARELPARRGYSGRIFELPNGDRIGVRWSKDHGTTVDVYRDTSGRLRKTLKFHWE